MDDSVRVLHVEDDPDFAELVAEFLERAVDRFTVETTTSADAGLDRLDDTTVDCVVSDYDMPGMDGITFLEAVRESHPDLPFVLFTGKGSEEVASEAISAGVTDYLQKGTGTDQYTLLANRVLNAVEQRRATRLAETLERVTSVIRNVNGALARATSRAEIDTRVCEILSAAEPYVFVWIGEYDPDGDRVVPRSSAGFEAGYLDAIRISVDEGPTRLGPTGTAVRTGSIQVMQNILDDPDYEPWRTNALERGYRSSAAIPLVHEGTLYGVLNVYADRSNAFDGQERRLLSELGETIAHAHHRIEAQKRVDDQYRTLFAHAPVPSVLTRAVDGEPVIEDVNREFANRLGYEREELLDTSLAEVYTDESARDLSDEDGYERAMSGEFVRQQRTLVTRDGDEVLTVLRASPRRDSGGDIVGTHAMFLDISDERQLEALNETTQALIAATERDVVARIGVHAAKDVLGLDANAIHLYDEDRSGLVPVAVTDAGYEIVGEPPTFTNEDSIAWRVFERGESITIDDVREDPDVYNPDTTVRGELYLPLGEYGILIATSRTSKTFDERDVVLGELLAGTVATALEQAERRAQLRARERELLHQNDRLEEFASVVSHDLRNPLNVARGRLEFVRSECDSEHLDPIEHALDRMRTLIDDLLTLAKESESVMAFDEVDLGGIVAACWRTVDTDGATLLDETNRVVFADEGRLSQLLENLFRNAVDHAGADVTITVGHTDGGFYVADDGPGIPEEKRELVFESGYSTSETGTGLGLSIVSRIVEAHGWQIGVTESDSGGARFEITGVEWSR